MSFEELRDECLRRGVLFEDNDFPATSSSVYFTKRDPYIKWKRPREIVDNPQMFVGTASRLDLVQGKIGDCWFISAATCVTNIPELFEQVVPRDQGFDHNYAGIFHFFFWRYGAWEEVVVDDRLPTGFSSSSDSQLEFCHNPREPNEFWSALLEKAYAKLHGSYEALTIGVTTEAFVDLTGGVVERLNLSQAPRRLFSILMHNQRMNTVMACGLAPSPGQFENVLSNGLVVGHAYAVTKVAKIELRGTQRRLLRLRNPWGKTEWNGAWSDSSSDWIGITDETKRRLGLVKEEDGEFWISFEDFMANFDTMEICHLPPGYRKEDTDQQMSIQNGNVDPESKENWTYYSDKFEWHQIVNHGSWMIGHNAGGSGMGRYGDRELYWTNPQYTVTLSDVDDRDDDDEGGQMCTLIVSLMQKYGRKKRTEIGINTWLNFPIALDLYKLKDGVDPNQVWFDNFREDQVELVERGEYQTYREVTGNFRVEPGNYMVMASTQEPYTEGEFLLRIYTEKDVLL